MENNKNNIEKGSAGISAYIKKILNHEFESLSEIPDSADPELVESIISLAAEYRNSLIRTEDYVRNLAEAENKVSRTQKIRPYYIRRYDAGFKRIRRSQGIKNQSGYYGYSYYNFIRGGRQAGRV